MISRQLIPAAIHPSTSPTVMRNPHGRLSAALARLDGDKLTVIHVYFDASMSPVL